ncbi:MAG: 4-hydroxy-tetrahydrodipicolinate reductase [Beijerinckiaceae bacterium]
MSTMRLIVVGAAGRMGQALVRAVIRSEGVTLAAAIEREGSPALGQDAGLLAGAGATGIMVSADPLAAFAQADGVLDFTIPAASVRFAGLAAQARLVHIVGTTGFSADDLARLRAAARHAILVQSGNFGLGVNVLAQLVRQAAKALDLDYDIEIVEMHHRMKIDAPSGTALLLGEAAAQGRGIALKDHMDKARDGHHGTRKPGDIGFASLRGGTVAGEHSVVFAGPGERITLSHSAESRDNFANGAVKAALWGRGRKPGLFSMADVLGLAD